MAAVRREDGTYRKRCERWNIPGHAHYLTFSCFHGKPLLSRDRSRSWLVEAINGAADALDVHIWAWVIMPEHAHLLVFPAAAPYEISDFLKHLKLSVSSKAIAWVRRESPQFLTHMADKRSDGTVSYRFWQRGGGHDRNIVAGSEVWEKMNYIHRNPVRRKLVTQPSEWLWSSARDHLGLGSGPVRLNRTYLT